MRPLPFSGITLWFLIAILCTTFSCDRSEKTLNLNQVQLIGSHNSYKQKIEVPVMEMILARDSGGIGLDYFHIPIREQLDLGLRSLEIDVLHDPVGGRYQQPFALKVLRQKGAAVSSYDTLSQLSVPGFKVIHVPDIDFRSHCYRFMACLTEVKNWSDEHPSHLPIIITINPKESGVKETGFTTVLPFSAVVLDSLEREIVSVLTLSKIILPDEVKGQHATLRESILADGWPALETVKGKILFVLDAGGSTTDAYVNDIRMNKVMFANVGYDHPDAAFFIMNDPVRQFDEIRHRVAKGFLVRTRADADTREARAGSYERFTAAMKCGAQVISTDYYLPKLSPDGKFQIRLPEGNYYRCNPLNTSGECDLKERD
jgi:hypothetical protein